MVGNLSSDVASWHSFYTLAGTASATFVGLVFVAVSLHLDLIGESGVSAIFTMARRTFSSFVIMVIIALVFLVPKQGSVGLGWSLVVIGAVDLILAAFESRTVASEVQRSAGLQNISRRLVFPVLLPFVGAVGLVVIGATLLSGTTSYLYWMVPIAVVILTGGAVNSWQLMLGLARHKTHRVG